MLFPDFAIAVVLFKSNEFFSTSRNSERPFFNLNTSPSIKAQKAKFRKSSTMNHTRARHDTRGVNLKQLHFAVRRFEDIEPESIAAQLLSYTVQVWECCYIGLDLGVDGRGTGEDFLSVFLCSGQRCVVVWRESSVLRYCRYSARFLSVVRLILW